MKLRETLLVYMLPLLVIPLALLGYFAYQASSQARAQQAFQQVYSQLQQQQHYLNDYLRVNQTKLVMLTSLKRLHDFLLDNTPSNQQQTQAAFQYVINDDPAIRSIKLLALNGDEVLNLPEQAAPAGLGLSNRFNNEYFSLVQAMIDDQTWFFAPDGPSRALQVFLVQKLYLTAGRTNRQLWGYLIMVVEAAPFADVVTTPVTPSSVSLLLNRTATIAYAANEALVGTALLPSQFRLIQQSVAQQKLHPDLLLGQPQLLLAQNITGAYQLLYGVDAQELYSHYTNWPSFILGLTLLSVIAVPMLVYLILIYQVFNPVKQLTAAKQAVGRGDFSTLLEVRKQDELGEMFASFNVMVRQLRVYRERETADKQQLEEKVLQRTQDLARANNELASANQALTLAREVAEQANRLKSVFLANMSHEIRTPLTAVIGFSEQALTEDDPATRADYLYRVLRSSEHLLGLINDILDLSKIEADKLELKLEPVDYLGMLTDIFQQTQAQAATKGIDCQLQLQYPLPAQVVCDSLRLRQVLLNLTSNALKFTRKGKVSLLVSFDAAESRLAIKVRDTGIGMNAIELQRLFQPFMQADATVTRDYGGTGLGLCISKKLMEAMDGDIQVESVKGIGSSFALIFPVAANSTLIDGYQVPVTQAKNSSEIEQPLKMHVLVAEDNEDNQLLLSLMLSKVGVSFELVKNGHQAVEAVLAKPFDLIFMDMQMPVMGGEEATRLIRHAGINTPVIAVTANVMTNDTERYRLAGCQAVLAKPIVQHDFIKLLQRYSTQVSLAASELARQLAQDPAMQALKSHFKAQLPSLVQQLVDYAAADNWPELTFAAHSLKGSAGSMGYPQLTALAGELEVAARQKNAAKVQAILQQTLTVAGVQTL